MDVNTEVVNTRVALQPGDLQKTTAKLISKELIGTGMQATPDLADQVNHWMSLGVDVKKSTMIVHLTNDYDAQFQEAVTSLATNFGQGTKKLFELVSKAWRSYVDLKDSTFGQSDAGKGLLRKREENILGALKAFNAEVEKRKAKDYLDKTQTFAQMATSCLLAFLPFCTGDKKVISGVNVASHLLNEVLDFAGDAVESIYEMTKEAEDLMIKIFKQKGIGDELKVEAYEGLEFFRNYYRIKGHDTTQDLEIRRRALERARNIADVLDNKDALKHNTNALKEAGEDEERLKIKVDKAEELKKLRKDLNQLQKTGDRPA